MSGAQVEVPLVIRASVGAGKGYGGQHSPGLESIFAHIPGMYVVYPATPYDAKGLLKSAIRDNNPVMFVESQGLYSTKGDVPEGEYLVPIGQARVAREGSDMTIVAWGPAVLDALKAADALQAEHGIAGGGHRPAQPRAAGHGDDAALRAQDGPLRRGQPGILHRQLRNEIIARDPAGGVRLPGCSGRARRGRQRHLARRPRSWSGRSFRTRETSTAPRSHSCSPSHAHGAEEHRCRIRS